MGRDTLSAESLTIYLSHQRREQTTELPLSSRSLEIKNQRRIQDERRQIERSPSRNASIP